MYIPFLVDAVSLIYKLQNRLRKVDVRLPGKGNSNSQGARPVHLITTMIKWIRTSRLSIKNSLSKKIRVPGSTWCDKARI